MTVTSRKSEPWIGGWGWSAGRFFTVLAAVLICLVVILLFAASLTDTHFGRPIALLFMGAMTSIGIGFSVFLLETRVGSRSVRIRTEVLEHMAEEREAD